MKRIIFPLLMALISACSSSDKYHPDKYLSKEEQQNLINQLAYYTEKKPDGMNDSNRFDIKWKSYYNDLVKQQNAVLKYYYETDSNTHFMIVKKDFRSLYEDYRAVGGMFKGKGAAIQKVDILFITPRLRKDTVDRYGDLLWKDVLENGRLKKYFGNYEYVEWPNPDVAYDIVKADWYFPEGSKYRVLMDTLNQVRKEVDESSRIK